MAARSARRGSPNSFCLHLAGTAGSTALIGLAQLCKALLSFFALPGILLLDALTCAFVNLRHVPLRWRTSQTSLRAAELPEKWKAGPAEVYSGVAQKAVYLMKENPTLFDMSVDEELEKLQEEKEEEEKTKSAMEANAKEDS